MEKRKEDNEKKRIMKRERAEENGKRKGNKGKKKRG